MRMEKVDMDKQRKKIHIENIQCTEETQLIFQQKLPVYIIQY